MYPRCPKCHSKAVWLEKQYPTHLYLRCRCGICMPIGKENKPEIVRPRNPLPNKDSQLYRSLMLLKDIAPATSGQVAARMQVPVVSISNQLCFLRERGLVEQLTQRRGAKGGSTWILSQTAIDAMEGVPHALNTVL